MTNLTFLWPKIYWLVEIRFKTSFRLSAHDVFGHINQESVFQLSTEEIQIQVSHLALEGVLHPGTTLDVRVKGMKESLKFIVTACKVPDRVVLHTREDSAYKGEWYIDFVSTTAGCNVREKLILHPGNVVNKMRLLFIKDNLVQAFKHKSLEHKSRLLQK